MRAAKTGLRVLGLAGALAGISAVPALARAGGGRSGSSRSSGGHYHSYNTYHSYHYYNSGYGYSGGYSGGGGFSWGLFFAIVGAVVAAIAAWVWFSGRKRRKLAAKADTVLEKLVEQDPIWNKQAMQERVEEVFYRVQEAWAECNQDLARDCMTNSLYERHKSQTDAMLRRGERNVLENVRLLDAQIVSVDDRDDDRKDKFWVYISGSMRDFTIIEASGEVIDGDVDAEISFNELWKFVRERNQWMLHAIEQDTSLAKLQEAKSESLPG